MPVGVVAVLVQRVVLITLNTYLHDCLRKVDAVLVQKVLITLNTYLHKCLRKVVAVLVQQVVLITAVLLSKLLCDATDVLGREVGVANVDGLSVGRDRVTLRYALSRTWTIGRPEHKQPASSQPQNGQGKQAFLTPE